MATIETLPLLLVFVILASYTFGAFGIVHTGILNSIAARTYAFETFRNRTNVTYFRDNNAANFFHYRVIGNRLHSINSEQLPPTNDPHFYATERPIRIGMISSTAGTGRNDEHIHISDTMDKVLNGKRNDKVEVDPVWVRTMYGICLSNGCGD
jgi:hypothetical protein